MLVSLQLGVSIPLIVGLANKMSHLGRGCWIILSTPDLTLNGHKRHDLPVTYLNKFGIQILTSPGLILAATPDIAYAYRLCLYLGKLSEQNTAYGMSLDLWTRVIPEYCAIMKSVIISFAYNSFQTCSNSILITVFSRKRMLHSIMKYSWHININGWEI